VPHGEIHHHFYKSGVVATTAATTSTLRRATIHAESKRIPSLPVARISDDASAWTAVGRTNVILDNLIAQGKAKPMLVAMPLGYGGPRFFFQLRVWRDRAITERNFNKFREALLTE